MTILLVPVFLDSLRAIVRVQFKCDDLCHCFTQIRSNLWMNQKVFNFMIGKLSMNRKHGYMLCLKRCGYIV